MDKIFSIKYVSNTSDFIYISVHCHTFTIRLANLGDLTAGFNDVFDVGCTEKSKATTPLAPNSLTASCAVQLAAAKAFDVCVHVCVYELVSYHDGGNNDGPVFYARSVIR